MTTFKENVQKPNFLFWPHHFFFYLIDPQIHAKSQKKLMNGLWDIQSRTDYQTDKSDHYESENEKSHEWSIEILKDGPTDRRTRVITKNQSVVQNIIYRIKDTLLSPNTVLT